MDTTSDVVTDMYDRLRLWSQREKVIERSDAIGLGRRDVQTSTDVVERPLRQPAEPRLHDVERRQKQVAAAAIRITQNGVDGRTLLFGRLWSVNMKVHSSI